MLLFSLVEVTEVFGDVSNNTSQVIMALPCQPVLTNGMPSHWRTNLPKKAGYVTNKAQDVA